MAEVKQRRAVSAQTQFVREYALHVAAKDIIREARAYKYKLTAGFIGNVRRYMRRSEMPPGTREPGQLPPPPPPEETPAASTKTTQSSKGAFVRAHPEMPSKELVAAAKEAGLTITQQYVWQLRSVDKRVKRDLRAEQSRRTKPARPAAKRGQLAPHVEVNGAAERSALDQPEQLLLAIAGEVGFSRSIAIIGAMVERLHGMLNVGHSRPKAPDKTP